jgi:predicted nucleotidyltransferase
VAIFGSYARGENNKDSDLDVLVHLNYSYPISLLDIAHVTQNLYDVLGMPVDIVTENSLSPYLKPSIEKDLIYIFG